MNSDAPKLTERQQLLLRAGERTLQMIEYVCRNYYDQSRGERFRWRFVQAAALETHSIPHIFWVAVEARRILDFERKFRPWYVFESRISTTADRWIDQLLDVAKRAPKPVLQ